jgi:hypothetical protein
MESSKKGIFTKIRSSSFKLRLHVIIVEFPKAEIHCSFFPQHRRTAASLDKLFPPLEERPPPSNEQRPLEKIIPPRRTASSLDGMASSLMERLPASTNGHLSTNSLPPSKNGLLPLTNSGLSQEQSPPPPRRMASSLDGTASSLSQ